MNFKLVCHTVVPNCCADVVKIVRLVCYPPCLVTGLSIGVLVCVFNDRNAFLVRYGFFIFLSIIFFSFSGSSAHRMYVFLLNYFVFRYLHYDWIIQEKQLIKREEYVGGSR